MASCRLAYLFVIACSLQLVVSEYVPVYMWGDLEISSEKANPLVDVSEEDFASVLKEQVDNEPFTVVFIEENLSVEDFSLRNVDGKSSFPYLRANLDNALYLPRVQSSLAALDSIANPEKVDHVKLTENGLSAEIDSENGKFLFVNLNDAKEGESRADMLRRHNDFMEEMFAKLHEKYDTLIAVYTAQNPSWTVQNHSRVRRATASNPDAIVLPNALLYIKNVTLKDGANSIQLDFTSSDSKYDEAMDVIEANLHAEGSSVKMIFSRNAGYWFFNRVQINHDNEVIDAVELNQVYAIEGFSYRCSETVHFNSVNTTKAFSLIFDDMQVQPFFTGSPSSFGDPYFCTGFTSVPIWAGLFVVAILLSIMFYGVIMMMDIRTMDRFDDPKGKTIAINAGE